MIENKARYPKTEFRRKIVILLTEKIPRMHYFTSKELSISRIPHHKIYQCNFWKHKLEK